MTMETEQVGYKYISYWFYFAGESWYNIYRNFLPVKIVIVMF